MTKTQRQVNRVTVTIKATASIISEAPDTYKKLQQGLPIAEADTELTFNDAAGMLSTLSEKRLELLTFLRKYGSITIKELSRQLHRNYSNVHEDVQLLLRLGLLAKDKNNKIYVPWDELNIRLPLKNNSKEEGGHILQTDAREGSALDLTRTIKQKREQILRIATNHGVHNVRVFGSVARGESDKQSDIDFLVSIGPEFSLMDHVRLEEALKQLLKRNVDVVSDGGLKRERFRHRVLREAIPL